MCKELEAGFKVEIVEITDNFLLKFFHIPAGYSLSSCELEGYTTKKIGKLNGFNKVKVLAKWRVNNQNLVKDFTKLLKIKGWDFSKYPNPTAYASFK